MGADDPGGSKGLLKWKGVMFAPSDTGENSGKCKIVQEDKDASDSATLSSLHEQGHEVKCKLLNIHSEPFSIFIEFVKLFNIQKFMF